MAQRKRKNPLPETGFKLVALGLGMLLAPWVIGSDNVLLGAVAPALRVPGWACLAAGMVMLSLHLLLRKPAGTRSRNRPVRATGNAPSRSAAPRKSQPDRGRRHTEEVRAEMDRDQQTLRADRENAAAAAPDLPTEWSPEVFGLMEWRRFEQTCEALFQQAGFETRSQSHGADGGVDIWLHSPRIEAPVAIAQCKHWKGQPVPVEQVRAFYGVMAAHGLQRGTFATSSTFTADALAFGQANGINMQDGAGLLALIAKRTPEQQAQLLAIALEGEFWRPSCPSCGDKLVKRQRRKSGRAFWGCHHYPKCRYTLPMTPTEAALLARPRATRRGQGTGLRAASAASVVRHGEVGS